MLEIYKGISLEIIFCFEHYANTFRNFIFNIVCTTSRKITLQSNSLWGWFCFVLVNSDYE